MNQTEKGSGKRIVWGAPDDALKDKGIMAYTPEKRAEILRLLKRANVKHFFLWYGNQFFSSTVRRFFSSW